ncbi:MAG TPA: metalloregulator ArsR/SmtB family transcription factor [Jatrophihabitans sp.]|jgi:ArsR family transcriptional regulator|uniref:ArsR/SmtB family transcription factor n=1 Tax=Jatrophihabitans sp. TaxID=1932789 RepID=UPI002DFEC992|nr:metalloregulator ArsR/SmtB family transcription factor [Jatrophihabitans sp.]
MSKSIAGPGGRTPLKLTPLQAVACCSPLLAEPMSTEQAEQVAALLKALSDPVRLRIVSLVAAHADGEACVCDITEAFDLSQPTISHHLKVLHELGLLDRDKRGVWVHYRVNADALRSLGAWIGTLPDIEGARPTVDA